MIQLDPSLYIASGNTRDVYRHPEDNNKCIKINKYVDSEANLNEVYFLEKYMHVSIMPTYYGCVETSLGTGIVVELILDSDGLISKSFEDYLPTHANQVKEYFIKLEMEILSNNILMHDPGLQNVLLKKDRRGFIQPVLIDGFGFQRKTMKNRIREKSFILSKIKSLNIMKRMMEKIDVKLFLPTV